MRSAKVSLRSNISGLSCELVFEAKTQPIQEARQVLWSGSRRIMDATRFAQFGQWTGEIKTPSGKIQRFVLREQRKNEILRVQNNG